MTSDDWSVGKVRGADGLRGRFEGALRDLRGRRLTSVDYWDVHNAVRGTLLLPTRSPNFRRKTSPD